MSDDAKSRDAKAPKGETARELPGAGTPEGEKLREANAAFEAGNYALVRTLTEPLAKSSDPKVASAANDLVRRVSVDPVQLAFLIACAFALAAITWTYVGR